MGGSEEGGSEQWGRLVLLSGGEGDVSLTAASYVVGRRSGTFPRFKNIRVSGRHCKLARMGSRFFTLEDISTNGTFVNGKKVGKGNVAALRHLDVVSLSGPWTPTVPVESAPHAPPPVPAWH